MRATDPQQSFKAVLLASLAYLIIGIVFAILAKGASLAPMQTAWRLVAWFTSASVFTIHIWYEHFRLRNLPFKASLHVSLAMALGAMTLALAAYLQRLASSENPSSLAWAIIAWPLFTALPGFLIAFVSTTVIDRIRRNP